jgi:hypothetical protein
VVIHPHDNVYLEVEFSKYIKWLKSHCGYHQLRQTFSDIEIEKYLEYIEVLKTFDPESVNAGNPKVWIVDKFLHVTSKKDDMKRFDFVVIGKPLQVNNACYVKNMNRILATIHKHKSFGEYLETIMQKPDNNNVWVSTMKTRLILDGKLYSEHENEIDKSVFDIFEFISAYSNDPIIVKWSQHCALACIAKDIVT